MKPLPLPLRLAAGLAVTAKERAQDLPRQLVGLPITLASQVLQLSMRVQQQVTELAIKGDEALSGLQPVEETPSWATFDEDFARPRSSRFEEEFAAADLSLPTPRPRPNDNGLAPSVLGDEPDNSDPWEEEERALSEAPEDDTLDTADAPSAAPAWLPSYDELSLPQLRARLRGFSVDQLKELLSYERSTANRPEFAGMLSRRIETVRAKGSGK